MRRSGRTDVKIPILMPDEGARRQIFEVTVKKHKLGSTVADYAPFAKRTAGFTGSDIELAITTAWRFALRDGKAALDEASIAAALDDLLPTTRDQAAIDRMTLLALDECRNKRLLPRNHEQIRAEIQARTQARG
jgi:ATP-dependent 26S proteasome regulatory subunit